MIKSEVLRRCEAKAERAAKIIEEGKELATQRNTISTEAYKLHFSDKKERSE